MASEFIKGMLTRVWEDVTYLAREYETALWYLLLQFGFIVLVRLIVSKPPLGMLLWAVSIPLSYYIATLVMRTKYGED